MNLLYPTELAYNSRIKQEHTPQLWLGPFSLVATTYQQNRTFLARFTCEPGFFFLDAPQHFKRLTGANVLPKTWDLCLRHQTENGHCCAATKTSGSNDQRLEMGASCDIMSQLPTFQLTGLGQNENSSLHWRTRGGGSLLLRVYIPRNCWSPIKPHLRRRADRRGRQSLCNVTLPSGWNHAFKRSFESVPIFTGSQWQVETFVITEKPLVPNWFCCHDVLALPNPLTCRWSPSGRGRCPTEPRVCDPRVLSVLTELPGDCRMFLMEALVPSFLASGDKMTNLFSELECLGNSAKLSVLWLPTKVSVISFICLDVNGATSSENSSTDSSCSFSKTASLCWYLSALKTWPGTAGDEPVVKQETSEPANSKSTFSSEFAAANRKQVPNLKSGRLISECET